MAGRPYGRGPYGRGPYSTWPSGSVFAGGGLSITFGTVAKAQRIPAPVAGRASIQLGMSGAAVYVRRVGGAMGITFRATAEPQRIQYVAGFTQITFGAYGAIRPTWPALAPCEAGSWARQSPCEAGTWTPLAACEAGTWTRVRP